MFQIQRISDLVRFLSSAMTVDWLLESERETERIQLKIKIVVAEKIKFNLFLKLFSLSCSPNWPWVCLYAFSWQHNSIRWYSTKYIREGILSEYLFDDSNLSEVSCRSALNEWDVGCQTHPVHMVASGWGSKKYMNILIILRKMKQDQWAQTCTPRLSRAFITRIKFLKNSTL